VRAFKNIFRGFSLVAPDSLTVPHSRLPFVNAEFAEVHTPNGVRLVTSIWGGKDNGIIFLIDPMTGECERKLLPEGEPGAYMLQTGPDGRLYLGGGNGNLFRYDPTSDTMETLVTGQMHGITWGGCVTDQVVVWSANPGEACVYDWREDRLTHVLKPLDTEDPTALYGHRIIQAPDGRILFAMNVPQARMIVLDPDTGERQCITPEVLQGESWTRDATFFDEKTVGVFGKKTWLFFRYPTFEFIRSTPLPIGEDSLASRASFCGGKFYSLGMPTGSLYELNTDKNKWMVTKKNLVDSNAIQWALDKRYICTVNVTGNFMRHDLVSGDTFHRELDAWGPIGVHALCPIPEIGEIFGAPFINQRFWQIDMADRTGKELGRAADGGGQINYMLWDPQTRKVLMASYTTASITAFDPEQPPHWPDNPMELARVDQKLRQMRPLQLVYDGRYVWMVTSPIYGLLGGALSRVDPKTGEIKTWRNLIEDQTPNAMVIDQESSCLFGSTTISADCGSAPPTQTAAKLFVFDREKLKLQSNWAPLKDCGTLKVWATLPNGEILTGGQKRLYAWTPGEQKWRGLGPEPEGLREVIYGPNGKLYASTKREIGQLLLENSNPSIDRLSPEAGRFLRIAEGQLWYAVDQEIRCLDLDAG